MGKHSSHQLHTNSLAALAQETQALSERAREVYNVIPEMGGLTDRQIMQRLGYHDMNAVRPRITELVQGHFLAEVGSVIDYVTRKRVRLVARVQQQPELF